MFTESGAMQSPTRLNKIDNLLRDSSSDVVTEHLAISIDKLPSCCAGGFPIFSLLSQRATLNLFASGNYFRFHSSKVHLKLSAVGFERLLDLLKAI